MRSVSLFLFSLLSLELFMRWANARSSRLSSVFSFLYARFATIGRGRWCASLFFSFYCMCGFLLAPFPSPKSANSQPIRLALDSVHDGLSWVNILNIYNIFKLMTFSWPMQARGDFLYTLEMPGVVNVCVDGIYLFAHVAYRLIIYPRIASGLTFPIPSRVYTF